MTNRLGPCELNTIVTGECSALMAALPSRCIDMWITSPPYGEMRAYNGFTFDFEAIAAQLYRVTKEGGVGVWVVADETKNGSETLTSFRQALYFRELGFNVETMIYEVAGTGAKGSNYYYWQAFEYMFILAKGQPVTSNRIADIKNKDAGKPRGFRTKSARLGSRVDRPHIIAPEYSVRPNVWRYAVGQNDDTIHPAPFPEALARDHILSWSNPGDICLDPMVGSGTTAKQAHLLGRHYLGYDISSEYCELARRRLADVEAQPFLMPVVSEVNGKPTQAKLLP